MSKLFEAIGKAKRERTFQEDADVLAQPLEPVRRLTVAPSPAETAKPVVAREPLARKLKEGRFGPPEEHLVSLIDSTCYEAEQYRTLRHLVEQKKQVGVSVIAVTSPTLGDGKTTTAINLAGSLAQAKEARVLLLDADLRRPSVGHQLGLSEGDGEGLVSAILDATLTLDDVVRFHRKYNLAVCPAGRPQVTPYEMLKSSRVVELMSQARRDYDYVVVDTPPLVGCPDCRLLEKLVDGFLVVVTAHKTPRKLIEDGLSEMASEKLLGLVFNGESQQAKYYAAYGHGKGRKRGRA